MKVKQTAGNMKVLSRTICFYKHKLTPNTAGEEKWFNIKYTKNT